MVPKLPSHRRISRDGVRSYHQPRANMQIKTVGARLGYEPSQSFEVLVRNIVPFFRDCPEPISAMVAIQVGNRI